MPSSCGGLGLKNKVWGCALPAGSAREGEGIPYSLIQVFNAGAAAWCRLSTGAAASRRGAVFHLFLSLVGTSSAGASLGMGSDGKNSAWGSPEESGACRWELCQGFPLSHGRVNRNPCSVLSYCILTLWKVGG